MSLASAAAVLHLLKSDHTDVAVSELSALLGWPVSSASRLLKDMLELGLLERHPLTRRYRAGLLILELARQYRLNEPLLEAVDAEILELTRRTGFSTGISTLDGTDVVTLRSRAGTHLLQVVTPPGTRSPAWATSTGRCILARLTDEEIARRFTPFPKTGLANAPHTLEELMRRITRVRDQGWDDTRDEFMPGIGGVAVAIVDLHDDTAFAPYIAFSPIQVTRQQARELARMLQEMAARLNVRLSNDSLSQLSSRRQQNG